MRLNRIVNRYAVRPLGFESNISSAIERYLKSCCLGSHATNTWGADKCVTFPNGLLLATIVVGGQQSANAGFVGLPHALGLMMKRISLQQLYAAADGIHPVLLALCRPVQAAADGISRRPGSAHGGAMGRPEGHQQKARMRPSYRSVTLKVWPGKSGLLILPAATATIMR